jgi:hypothetical protein
LASAEGGGVVSGGDCWAERIGESAGRMSSVEKKVQSLKDLRFMFTGAPVTWNCRNRIAGFGQKLLPGGGGL